VTETYFSRQPSLNAMQEKAYNPYYTLLAANLCTGSHAHRFTLQYALWDFLRTLGETQVGGVQVIKSVEDGEPDFGGEGAGMTPKDSRIRNMARLYAWLIAKEHLGPNVFKVSLHPISETRAD
jgi:nucleolar MIF4G domain-containing protein 1